MYVMEELAMELVPGRSEREVLVKRFIFRANGCVFVYTSSVPDEVHAGIYSGRDSASSGQPPLTDLVRATRYTLLFSIQCFKKVHNDLIME